ncbi:VOC family protein [Alienimonas californiensis]|uniref:Glyoxalase-like domain protein n=1 Tax=Alienimonas californiensis TaxID=2527989 RepID=A0A517P531_9PLAN|nr:VOC family protein [Alienimonas californiensis]QDT14487.1 Glyoxalase-like domain protein [Alienimonas californiensis]
MPGSNTINYLELPMADSAATRAFYEAAFGWSFTEYGPDYLAFAGAGLDGGFDGARPVGEPGAGPLPVLYHADLAAAQSAVEDAGGTIAKPIYAFPGGRRFHFTDPTGNELAVWSE